MSTLRREVARFSRVCPRDDRVGADGALYVSDMYREIIEDYSAIPRFLQQQYGVAYGDAHGRIWRLVSAENHFEP